jgi:hypothetical protein
MPPSVDSGVFLSVAHHIKAGLVLYRDVWDHKPPLVYFLDYMALMLGDGTVNSVRLMEKAFMAVGGILCFGILIRLVRHSWVAFLGALFFLMVLSSPRVFEGGNLTEEYGAVVLLGGIYLCIVGTQKSNVKALLFGGAAGFLFGASIAAKEPFIFSCIPWIAHYTLLRKGEFRPDPRRLAAIALGSCGLIAVVGAYFVYNHAVFEWLDVLSYNYQYVARSHTSTGQTLSLLWTTFYKANGLIGIQSIILWLVALAGIVSAVDFTFAKENEWFPVTVCLFFAVSFFGVALSGWNIGAYFMQLVPAWILLGAYGAVFLRRLCSEKTRLRLAIFLLLGVILIVWDQRPLRDYANRVHIPFKRYESNVSDPLLSNLRCHLEPGDRVWQSMYLARIYFETEALSPTKYIYAFPWLFLDTWLSTAAQKRELIISQIMKSPPKIIIFFLKKGSLHESAESIGESSNQLMAGQMQSPYDLFLADLLRWMDREYSLYEVVPANLRRSRESPHSVYEVVHDVRGDYWIYIKQENQ